MPHQPEFGRVMGCVRMRKFAFAATIAVFFSMPFMASATDLLLEDFPASDEFLAPIWTGFYFGAHIGGARGEANINDVFDYNGDPEANNSLRSSSVIAGVQLGYNIQSGNFVYGVEADLGYLDLSDSKSVQLPNPTGKHTNDIGTTYSLSGDLYGDLTARIGYVAENVLVYLKGGAAFLNADFRARYVGENCTTKARGACGPNDPSTFDFGHSETLWGWTLGGGVEYALSPSWSIKLEYQHFDFGGMSYDYSGEYAFKTGGGKTLNSKLFGETDIDTTVDVIKLGVNYRVGERSRAALD